MKKIIQVEAVIEFTGKKCEPSCEHFYLSRNGEERFCLLFSATITERRHTKCIEAEKGLENETIITNVVNITKDMIRKSRADKGKKRGPRAKKTLVHYNADGSVEQPITGGN